MLKNPDWKKKVKPDLDQGERNIRGFLKVFAVMVFCFTIAVFLTSIYSKQRSLTLITLVCLAFVFSSWIKLNPALYNFIHKKKKLIPMGENTDKKKLLENIYLTITPYGKPIAAQYGRYLFPAPIYVLDQLGWIVYFYIKNSDVYIRCKTIKSMNEEAYQIDNKNLMMRFQGDLVKLFNFTINMERQPSPNEIEYIFEDTLSFKKNLEQN